MPYFSARLDFPSSPLSAPGSPRMDNIDLNQMSRRYVSGVLQNETSTSVHLIDRCENVNNVEKKSTSNMLIMEALNSPEIRKNTKATTVNKGQNFHCYNNDYNIMISLE